MEFKTGGLRSWRYTGLIAIVVALFTIFPDNASATKSSTFHHRADRWCASYVHDNLGGQCVSARRRNHCPRGFRVIHSFGGPVRGYDACVGGTVQQQAEARCDNFLQKHHEQQCRVIARSARCPSGFKHDKSFGSLQTCIPGYRHAAELYCADYTRLRPGKQCRVAHRGRLCPSGFRRIHTFGGVVHGYKSCIPGKKGTVVKQGLKRAGNAVAGIIPPIVPPFVPTVDPGSLVSYYKVYFKYIRGHSKGRKALPDSIIETYQRYYRNSLYHVHISESSQVYPGNAMTDCQNIYFPVGALADDLKTDRAGFVINSRLLHELAHTEQCQQKGGRNNYALYWWATESVGFVKAWKRDPGSFGNRIHDKNPMEQAAERKAQCLMNASCRPSLFR